MDPDTSNLSIGRWHKPKLYGTIVALCFLVFSGAIIITTNKVVLATTAVYCPQCDGDAQRSLNVGFWIVVDLVILGLSIPAVMLVRDKKDNENAKHFAWAGVAMWTAISIFSFFSILAELSEPPFNTPSWSTVSLWGLIWSGTGIMWVFLRKRYSKNSA